MNDPYTRAYKHLTGIIRDAMGGIDDPVPVKNFTDLTDEHPTFKDLLACADFPGAVLTQGGFGGSPWEPGGNNTDVVTRQTYRLEIAERSMHIPRVNQIKWAVLAALTAAGQRLQKTPHDPDFIDSWRISEGRDQGVRPELSAVYTIIAIELTFRHPLHALQTAGAFQ